MKLGKVRWIKRCRWLAWADFWVRGFRGSPLGGLSVFTPIRMATTKTYNPAQNKQGYSCDDDVNGFKDRSNKSQNQIYCGERPVFPRDLGELVDSMILHYEVLACVCWLLLLRPRHWSVDS